MGWPCMTKVCRPVATGPSLLVNVEECTGEFRQLSNQFTAQLARGGVAELQQLGMRIMKATCSGKLLSHPCIMGIVLQCIDVVNREERGIHTLKQPRKMGDKEQALIQQAVLLLTSNGCSGDLMRAMGFSKLSFLRSHSNLDSLLSQGLPCAPLALLKPSVMQQNVALISQMLPPLPGLASKQRMVLCFDFTYLLPLHTPMTLHEDKGLAGGPYSIGHESLAFHRLGQPLLDDVKASRMTFGHIWTYLCHIETCYFYLFLIVHKILRSFRKPFIECCSGFWQTQIIRNTKQHHFVESPREWHETFLGSIIGFPAPGWNSCFGIPRARASRLWAQYLCPWLWSGWVKGQSLAVHGRFGSSLWIWNDMRWYYLNFYENVWDALRWYENISSIEWFPDRFILQFVLTASFAFYSFL